MAQLSTGDEIVAAAVLVLQAAAACAVGLAVARRVAPGDRLVGAVAGWLGALATAVVVPLALGAATVLHRTTSVVAHAIVLAAAVRWLVRNARGVPPGDASPAAERSWFGPLAVGAGVAILAMFVVLSLGPPSRDTDTREYHITNLATWLREGSIWELPYQSPGGVTATHPGDSELLALWAALPSHGDELAYLAPLAFGVLLVLGSALLARELAALDRPDPVHAAVGALAGLAVLTVPIFATTQTASLSNDVTVAACTVAALGLLALARRRGAVGPVTLAGVALGLSLGSKYTALVPGATTALAAIWLLPRRREWWCLVPGVAVLALPWYLRNLIHTGNPIFPQALGPLPGGETPFQVMDDPVAAHILAGNWTIVGDWFEFLARRVGPIVAFAAAGVLVAFRSPRPVVGRVCVIIGAAAMAGYLAVPFSGGGPSGLPFLIVSSLRYSMTSVAVLAACTASLPWRRLVVGGAGIVGGWNLWQLRTAFPRDRPDVGFGDRHLVVAVLVGAVVAAAVAARPAPQLVHRVRAWVVPMTALAVFAGAALCFHRFDRGDSRTELEAALVVEAGETDPVVVLGVLDLRSLLGPRLRRPILGAPRGGELGEIPFSDANQIRRVFLGDATSPPAPAEFGPALDDVLAEVDAATLVVGPLGGGAFPEGWVPDDRWCTRSTIGSITIYQRC